MFLLAIESSCDETSIAFLQQKKKVDTNPSMFLQTVNSVEILGSVISSQIMVHREYGGVIPELGAREHAHNIHEVLRNCLHQAAPHFDIASGHEMELLQKVDTICVTTNPGLISALRVGMETAKSLKFFAKQQYGKEINIVPVNHLHGHVASCFLKESIKDTAEHVSNKPVFPHLHLLVSGGNSQIILMKSWSQWEIIGKTLDDAAGECFDKCGRMLGILYPAGVSVSQIAGVNNLNPLNFSVGMNNNAGLDMSFSGLKTAVRYDVQKQNIENFSFEKALTNEEIETLIQAKNVDDLPSEKLRYIKKACQSIQTVIVKQLANKLKRAIKNVHPASLGLSGGVSANPLLRAKMNDLANEAGISTVDSVFLPQKTLTGDNAVMIGLAGMLSVSNDAVLSS